jgi:DNA helicase II / ATP-dependent DNA helicase PcrA
MPESPQSNPAEIAAQKALDEMYSCIRACRNFRLEAGAGAGKTYSLVKALKLVIGEQGAALQHGYQKVACITYTNVATDEITARTDGHSAVHASTIHAFCWGLIQHFQPQLRTEVTDLEAWSDKLAEEDGVGARKIDYDLGYRSVNETHLLLHHDDVLTLMVALMERPKFRRIFAARFPILFIDEYQDTNAAFAESILKHFVASGDGPLVGLFGDSWQKIYGNGIGLIEHDGLKVIGKEANFRSDKRIVDALNSMRPELPQEVSDPEVLGSVAVYHTNEWVGTRQSGNHWKGDLPTEEAHWFLAGLRQQLTDAGWDFDPDKTKILMLTHKVLASEQGYSEIAKAFRHTDAYIKKEDPFIEFLVDTVEPACEAFLGKRYGEMFDAIGTRSDRIRRIEDKQAWSRDMQALIELRESGTVGQVLDLLKGTNRPRLPDSVKKTESKLATASAEELAESRSLTQISKLHEIPYAEITSLAHFVNDHTPFSTKHGVKGAQFENVLVVLGRGWNKYNWDNFLKWFPNRFPANKADSYERNRNLFYVACSRPKQRLALLFTQMLSEDSLGTLRSWFGTENVIPFEPE